METHTTFMDWVTAYGSDASFLQNWYTGLMQFLSKFQQGFFLWIYTRLFYSLYGKAKEAE